MIRNIFGVPVLCTALVPLLLCGCYDNTDNVVDASPTRDAPREKSAGTQAATSASNSSTPSHTPPTTPPTTPPMTPPMTPPATPDPARAATPDIGDDVIHVVGMLGDRPPTWIAQTPRPPREMQFIAPGRAEANPAEVTAFFFGPGQGGSRDMNIARWEGQFSNEDGTPAKAGITDGLTDGGLACTFVELEGTYAAMGQPKPVENQKMIAAVVDAPSGNVFFRLVGPAETVDDHAEAFRAMVTSLAPM